MSKLGEEGKVEESQALMQKVEVLKRQQQDILTPQNTGIVEKVWVYLCVCVCVRDMLTCQNTVIVGKGGGGGGGGCQTLLQDPGWGSNL